uniref:Transmembrane protein n=1 Tax=Heterorhabditis bacteriophora TaxID=37862 RepID=A0A1I7WEE6_HETBA
MFLLLSDFHEKLRLRLLEMFVLIFKLLFITVHLTKASFQLNINPVNISSFILNILKILSQHRTIYHYFVILTYLLRLLNHYKLSYKEILKILETKCYTLSEAHLHWYLDLASNCASFQYNLRKALKNMVTTFSVLKLSIPYI